MGIILSSLSHLLYYGEKFAACFAITALLTCLVATMIFTLGLGVGLGYNYCFVDIKTKYKLIAPRYRSHPRGLYKNHPHFYHEYNPRRRPKNESISSYANPDSYKNVQPFETPYNRFSLKPYSGFVPQRDLEDEEEETLPNLSGDNVDNITPTITTALDNETVSSFNKIVNETATSPKDTLVNVTLNTNSTLAVNTTEISDTTGNVNSIDENVDLKEEFPKMSIPISGLDLIGLLSRLRAENRNYSLQIVT